MGRNFLIYPQSYLNTAHGTSRNFGHVLALFSTLTQLGQTVIERNSVLVQGLCIQETTFYFSCVSIPLCIHFVFRRLNCTLTPTHTRIAQLGSSPLNIQDSYATNKIQLDHFCHRARDRDGRCLITGPHGVGWPTYHVSSCPRAEVSKTTQTKLINLQWVEKKGATISSLMLRPNQPSMVSKIDYSKYNHDSWANYDLM